MSDERVWLRHKDTGGYFNCPAGVVDEWTALGFEPSDAPEEHNPVIAGRLAWLAEQQAAQQVTTKASAKSGPKNEE